MVAMKAMKAGARAMTGGDPMKKIAESTQPKKKDVKGVFAAPRTIAWDRLLIRSQTLTAEQKKYFQTEAA